MDAAQFMTHPVTTVGPDDDVGHLKALFERTGFHHLVVVEFGKVCGIVSDRDLLHAASPFAGTVNERPLDAATLHRKVHQIMSRNPVCAHRSADIAEVARLMVEHEISCVPVVSDANELVGLVTARDILRWVAREGAAM